MRNVIRWGFVAALGIVMPRAMAQDILYGITAVNSISTSPGLNIVSFASNTPGTFLSNVAMSGVVANHAIRSIDFNPANGQLYAVSTNTTVFSQAQLYNLNPTTGALTTIGNGFTVFNNSAQSIDFEIIPGTNEGRVISRNGVNVRVNTVSGSDVFTGPLLDWVAGDTNEGFIVDITAGAYRGDGTYFGWDFASDSLVRVGGVGGTPSADNSVATTIHAPSSALSFAAGIGMDINTTVANPTTAYVTHDDPATGQIMSLWTRDLATGTEVEIGTYQGGVFVTDIAVVPEPTMLLLGTAGVIGLGVRLRRRG
jgi:trimeric autotransporter adhesin